MYCSYSCIDEMTGKSRRMLGCQVAWGAVIIMYVRCLGCTYVTVCTTRRRYGEKRKGKSENPISNHPRLFQIVGPPRQSLPESPEWLSSSILLSLTYHSGSDGLPDSFSVRDTLGPRSSLCLHLVTSEKRNATLGLSGLAITNYIHK